MLEWTQVDGDDQLFLDWCFKECNLCQLVDLLAQQDLQVVVKDNLAQGLESILLDS